VADVTVYFVRCKSCLNQIEVFITSGHKTCTLFSPTWRQPLRCDCGAVHDYNRDDVLYRHEGALTA
jgi:hypothetical protein